MNDLIEAYNESAIDAAIAAIDAEDYRSPVDPPQGDSSLWQDLCEEAGKHGLSCDHATKNIYWEGAPQNLLVVWEAVAYE